jgi:hypothetical protein
LFNRNLISISHWDKDGLECHFGHGQCAICCNNACVGIAYLHDELYFLSLCENSICDVDVTIVNVSRVEDCSKENKENS